MKTIKHPSEKPKGWLAKNLKRGMSAGWSVENDRCQMIGLKDLINTATLYRTFPHSHSFFNPIFQTICDLVFAYELYQHNDTW
jgi:hypothetical protein